MYEDYTDLCRRRYINGRIARTRDKANQDWSYAIFNSIDDENFLNTLDYIEKYNKEHNKTIQMETVYEGKIYIMGNAHKFLFEEM